jgi:uncharacterized membrane protein
MTGAKIKIITLILLTWKIWLAPNNAGKWQMGFNSAFKVLMLERNLRCPEFFITGDSSKLM